MSSPSSSRLDVAVALLLLAAVAWAAAVMVVVWAADLDGSGGSSSVALGSAVILVLGAVGSVVAGRLSRRWRTTSVFLLASAVVAALPWLTLLG